MRKFLVNFFVVGLKTTSALVILSLFFLIFHWYNNHLFIFEAKMIWPQNNFSERSFKSGNTVDRASMAADVIEKQIYVGTECKKIPGLLGESTGDYYYQDSNYTYRLTDKESTNWIL